MSNLVDHISSSARNQFSVYWEWSKKNRAAVITTLVATTLATWKWGKMVGVFFTAASIPNLPFFVEKINHLCRIEFGPLKQAAAILSIPAVYFCAPLYASLYLPPLCLTVAISIIKREWDRQEVAKKSQQEIVTLKEQTDRLSKARDGILLNIAKVERIMNSWLTRASQGKQLVLGHNQTTKNMNEVDLKIDDQWTQIENKCNQLQSFYEEAMKILQSQSEMENRLSELVEQCKERQKELAELNQKILGTSEQLNEVVTFLENEK